jgi:hypothetical protein
LLIEQLLRLNSLPAEVNAPRIGATIRPSVWSALDFRPRSAEGFVILPSVRHESPMTPFLFNTLAIGTIPANLREIAKVQGTDRYQDTHPAIVKSINFAAVDLSRTEQL